MVKNSDMIVMAKFLSKVIKKDDGCWIWRLSKDRYGYGKLRINNVTHSAHRFSYFIHGGKPIGRELYLDHICRDRTCVNPSHLRVVTARESALINNNSPWAINHNKTHCKNGHPLDGANVTYRLVESGNKKRRCMECHRRENRESYLRCKLRLQETLPW